MDKQNPFSLYDFLGYFTPGAVLLYAVFAICNRFLGYNINERMINLGFTESQILVGLILLSYILGHALSLSSSLFVEKFAIWLHGYPSKYLLRIKSPGYLRQWISSEGETKAVHIPFLPLIVRLSVLCSCCQSLSSI